MLSRTLALVSLLFLTQQLSFAEEPQPTYFLWSGAAAGLSTEQVGRVLPAKQDEDPPAIRVAEIQHPFLKRFDPPADQSNGTSVVIIPGGAYRYAVVGKEGAEVAHWFNSLGVTAFVLYYRNPTSGLEQDWLQPVQDAQRAVRLVRSHAQVWKLDPLRIGLIGFSAGGNAAAIAATKRDVPVVEQKADPIDEYSPEANFLMLIYPWKLLNKDETGLRDEVVLNQHTPPTFLVHTHDDGATSLSSIEFYKEMKRLKLPAELHLYESGGHGYGLRPVAGSNVHTWTDRASDWLKVRGLLQ